MCICAPCSPAGTVLPTPATALLWNPPSSRPPSVAQAGRCYAETPQSAAERSHPLHSVCAYDLAWCLWEEGACVRPMPGWDHLRSSPVGLLPRWDSLPFVPFVSPLIARLLPHSGLLTFILLADSFWLTELDSAGVFQLSPHHRSDRHVLLSSEAAGFRAEPSAWPTGPHGQRLPVQVIHRSPFLGCFLGACHTVQVMLA